MRTPIRLRPSDPRLLAAGLGAVALLAGCSGSGDTAVAPAPTSSEAPAPDRTMPELGTTADELPETVVTFVSADGERHEVPVRVAATPSSRQVGLMNVEELPADVGMLFLMDAPVDHGFWMKDTLVPLDIAYIGTDGRIVSIRQMEPCPDYEVATEDCPSYPPGATYDRTVEMRAGSFAAMGVAVGDRVEVADQE